MAKKPKFKKVNVINTSEVSQSKGKEPKQRKTRKSKVELRTSNYYKEGEQTKRINRQLDNYRKFNLKSDKPSEEFKSVQNYIKGLPKELRRYDRKKGMYVLTTPRNKEGKEAAKLVRNRIEETLPPYYIIKLINDKLTKKYDREEGYYNIDELINIVQDMKTINYERISGYLDKMLDEQDEDEHNPFKQEEPEVNEEIEWKKI